MSRGNPLHLWRGGCQWLRQTGEHGLWSVVDSALSMPVGERLRKFMNPKHRQQILQVAYKALQKAFEPV